MINRIVNLLQEENLFYYQVREIQKNSYQLFFIKHELDMNREVDVKEYYINIFVKEMVGKSEKYGKASFQLYDSMSDEEIKEKIQEQMELCKYTLKEPFEFSKKYSLKDMKTTSSFDGQTLKDAAFIAADALFEADKYDKGYINSAEIFINHDNIIYKDSNKNTYAYSREYGQIEFIVTWVEKEKEIETYKFFEFDSLDIAHIRNVANDALREAVNRIRAVPTPIIDSKVKLLLTNEAVKQYFSYFMNKARVENIYDKSSTYYKGYVIQKNENADKISLILEPVMKNSTKGMPFDEEGTILKKLLIIDDGVVKNVWGNREKSQLLDYHPNGIYENFVAKLGTLKDEDLEDEDYVEVVSFSDFTIDNITGDFCSEIRLGYYHKSQEKEPLIITKGSVSGSINDSLETVKFSSERKQQNNFDGPKSVLIDDVKFMRG